MKFILGRKLNMSQVFTENGIRIPVTVLQVGPCKVVQVKSSDKDGYTAVQIGFGSKKHLNKASKGHQKDNSYQFLNEFRVADEKQYKVGQEITAGDFQAGEIVEVKGVMKGRGFAGAMKRHGFHGAPASHGHDHPRAVGSIGSRFPQHTLKGTRMAGRMGGQWVTVKNLTVMDVDAEKNYLVVSGAVPGTRQGLVKVVGRGGTAKDAIKLHSYQKIQKDEKKEEPKNEETKELKNQGTEEQKVEVKAETPVKESK